MRLRNLGFALVVAIFLHVMTGFCLGIILLAIDSRNIAPEFRSGLTSIELNLVAVAAPKAPSLPTAPEVTQLEAIHEDKQPPQEEKPVEVAPVDSGVEEAFEETTTEVRPRYPLGSRLRGEEGVVTIRVWITASGRVSRAEVVETSGFPSLDEAGIKAARKATFRNPHGGIASSTETTVTFRFKLVD